jgi:hypothetical protein
MTTVKTKNVSVLKIPVEDLDDLRPFAKRAGHAEHRDGAVTRWAVIELAKRLRRESKDAAPVEAA